METIIEVSLTFGPLNDASLTALNRPGSPFKAQEVALQNRISGNTLASLGWPPPRPFGNVNDPEEHRKYIALLSEFVLQALDVNVLADLTPGLTVPGGCSLKIVHSDATLCIPCGTKCHIVNGTTATSCQGPSMGLYTITGKDGGKPVSYVINLQYTLTLEE